VALVVLHPGRQVGRIPQADERHHALSGLDGERAGHRLPAVGAAHLLLALDLDDEGEVELLHLVGVSGVAGDGVGEVGPLGTAENDDENGEHQNTSRRPPIEALSRDATGAIGGDPF